MDKKIFLILGDQLSEEHPFLQRKNWQKNETLMMIESLPRANWLPYHPQKLLYVFACMRRFAHELKKSDPQRPFLYVSGSDESFTALLNKQKASEIHLVEPSEPRALEWISAGLEAKIVLHHNPFFLADDSLLPAKPPYLMENFYRKMRVRLNVLMEDGEPAGGQWNFDKDNRLAPDKRWEQNPPADFFSENWLDDTDRAIYDEVFAMLKKHLPADRFGDFVIPPLPTHRISARQFLKKFVVARLEKFGPYEDAMLEQSVGLFHSGLSALMNLQILSALEIVDGAAAAPAKVEMSSREGFIRQVIGWREFVRLIYIRHRKEYGESNFFGFTGALPPLYWGAPSKLNCLSTVVRQVKETAYSHHIPRLMVLGNFALLTNTNPHEVNNWFWSVYLDAYEWVVSPNVLGMSQFADGGVFATKPYVSGANYINKMSNYCQSCSYDPKQTLGDKACPFNALYWNFIDETQKLKVSRPSFARRMGMMWSVWNKKTPAEQEQIRARAEEIKAAAREGKI